MDFTDGRMRLEPQREHYEPGSSLRVLYEVENATADMVEISLGFHTEGKGSQDKGVVFVEQRSELRGVVDIQLPMGPLSYDGILLRICWALSLRARVDGDFLLAHDEPMTMGQTRSAQ